MTAKEIQQRNERAENLRVLQVDDRNFYVESAEGKILYRVESLDGENLSCTCGDFARNSRQAPDFRCKHILAVLNCVPNGGMENARFLDRARPKLDERFIMTIEGKDFVKYPGLLDLGHQKGISRIEVEPIQLPSKETGNTAICRATVVSKTGETFIDIGDANPDNVNSRIAKHLLRMASTRSIARALRSYTNIGMTCLEELESIDDVMDQGQGKPPRKPAPPRTANKKAPQQEQQAAPPPAESPRKPQPVTKPVTSAQPEPAPKPQDPPPQVPERPGMSEAQRRAVYNLSRRRGISTEQLETMCTEAFGVTLEHLSAQDASSFIRQLQSAA